MNRNQRRKQEKKEFMQMGLCTEAGYEEASQRQIEDWRQIAAKFRTFARLVEKAVDDEIVQRKPKTVPEIGACYIAARDRLVAERGIEVGGDVYRSLSKFSLGAKK